jgi:hypothetical protein
MEQQESLALSGGNDLEVRAASRPSRFSKARRASIQRPRRGVFSVFGAGFQFALFALYLDFLQTFTRFHRGAFWRDSPGFLREDDGTDLSPQCEKMCFREERLRSLFAADFSLAKTAKRSAS